MSRYVILGMVGDESDGGPDQSVDEAFTAAKALTYVRGLGPHSFEALITPEGRTISDFATATAFLNGGKVASPAKSWDPRAKKLVAGTPLKRARRGRKKAASSSSSGSRRGTMGPRLPGGVARDSIAASFRRGLKKLGLK